MTSWLRPWVCELGLREQGTLVVATRGCDSAPKFPLDSPERRLTAAFRYAIGIPFDEREVDAALGCFMISEVPTDLRIAMLEHYPLHWVMHCVHAMEALGFRYPDIPQRNQWYALYAQAVRSLHLNVETRDQYLRRLGEDRIANQNVVSL